jgi:hypothetical protein
VTKTHEYFEVIGGNRLRGSNLVETIKMKATFDVFSGVPREELKADKRSLPFDYVDSDASSDEEAPYGENIGKLTSV